MAETGLRSTVTEHLPEITESVYFTTARVVSDTNGDWLWINPTQSSRFATEDEAQSLANLSNHHASENGSNIRDYPYFVVRVYQTHRIEIPDA